MIEQKTSTLTFFTPQQYTTVLAGEHNPPAFKENVTIVMPISVGREHCAGEYLRAQLNVVNSQFTNSKLIFLIASTLQRYTYQLQGQNESAAKQRAIYEATQWKNNHLVMIEKAITNLQIQFVDWEELCQEKTFKQKLEIIQNLYQKQDVQQAFSRTINNFIGEEIRQKSIASLPNIQHANELCTNYLKEEAAVHLILADKGYEYVAYPRVISDALNVIYENGGISKNVLRYLVLKTKLAKENLNNEATQPTLKHKKSKQGSVSQDQALVSSLVEKTHSSLLITVFKEIAEAEEIAPAFRLQLISNICTKLSGALDQPVLTPSRKPRG